MKDIFYPCNECTEVYWFDFSCGNFSCLPSFTKRKKNNGGTE